MRLALEAWSLHHWTPRYVPCPFLGLSYLVILSLQENGGCGKDLNLASDQIRERTDIGPGTKMLFVLWVGRGKRWAVSSELLHSLGRFCVVGPLTSKILKAPVPCLVFLTSPFGKYWEAWGRIGLPCWITVLTALHTQLGLDGVRAFLGGRVTQGAGQCSSIAGRHPEGGVTWVPRQCVLGAYGTAGGLHCPHPWVEWPDLTV